MFFITPLIFIFITYYYLAKKKRNTLFLFFKTLFLKQISYILITFVMNFVLYF